MLGLSAAWPRALRIVTIDPKGLDFRPETRNNKGMKETDLTPILDLFHQLPEGTGKVTLLFALGFGALITIKAKGGLSDGDDFIWWD